MMQFIRVVFAATCLTTLLGCDLGGPAMYTVSGEVRFQGEPVERGAISFVPDDPTHRTAAERIVNGKYSLRTTAGSKKVEIMANRDNGPVNPVMGQAPQIQYIPEKYNVESELRASITPDGENRFDYDLKP